MPPHGRRRSRGPRCHVLAGSCRGEATRGLRCQGASGDRTAPIHARPPPTASGLRSRHRCHQILRRRHGGPLLPTLLGPHTTVQTIQNGFGSPEIAAPIVGADRVAVGVVGGFGASLPEPGHARRNGMEMIRFGAYAGLPPHGDWRLGRTPGGPRVSRWRCSTISPAHGVGEADHERRLLRQDLLLAAGMTLGEVMAR